jgi:hypothetical protein
LRELNALRNDVVDINASDTSRKDEALRLIEQSRDNLKAALAVLSGLV